MRKTLDGGVCAAALFSGQSSEIKKLLKSSMLIPNVAFGEGDDAGDGDGGDGGGSGDGIDPNDPVVKEIVRKAVADATTGLKAKNEEILGEKKKTKAELESFLEMVGGEEGVERLKKQREAAQTSELDKLLADGKHDEWFEQRTESMRKRHDSELAARDEIITNLTGERDAAAQALSSYRVNSAIDHACDEVAVKPQYREAVRRMVNDRIQIAEDEDGKVSFSVYEEDGKTPAFGPRGKEMTIPELVDSLREKMGDMFQPSTGGGSTGGGKGGSSVANPWMPGASHNMTEQGRITRENPELAKRLKAEAAKG